MFENREVMDDGNPVDEPEKETMNVNRKEAINSTLLFLIYN